MALIPFQPALRPPLPWIVGPADYQTQRRLFERIDAILTESKLDQEFLRLAIADQDVDLAKASAKELRYIARFSFVALRANVARKLTGLAHREFCARLADSPLLQWFLHVGQIDQVKVFSKSTSQRFERWVKQESLRKINDRLIELCILQPKDGDVDTRLPFDLKEAVVVDDAFFDTTCVKTTMHFPIDWVLLRDAVRTLMKGTLCIRKAGLKHRMPQEPEEFMREMNKLCMSMSAQRRAKDSKKARKAILRKMKKLSRRVSDHAQAHVEVLQERRAQSTLSEGRARVIIQRLEKVIEQVPAAIHQAHERIIGERQVSNKDKILSLYDEHLDIIVRGKAGAEVEFGNKLSLVENKQGLIIDYHLHREAIADSKLVEPSVKRLVEEMKLPVQKLWADRGMHSRSNEKKLAEYGVQSGLCPRNPRDLKERLKDESEREGMRRRGSTEGRIAIFKNVILGNPMKGKSLEARELGCGWGVLSHNLWVLARMPKAAAEEERRMKPKEQVQRESSKERLAA